MWAYRLINLVLYIKEEHLGLLKQISTIKCRRKEDT